MILQKLFDFLVDLKPEVRRIAVEQVLTFSNTPEYVPLFLAEDMKAIKSLKLLVNDTPVIIHILFIHKLFKLINNTAYFNNKNNKQYK